MEEVYRLFDRRCRTQTALAKLAGLRQRVRRFKAVGKTLQTLFTANVEKALTFLDDKLLAATSKPSSAAIGVTARCRRPSIASAPKPILLLALPWTCCARRRPLAAPPPSITSTALGPGRCPP
jgi:hypothetical protein